MRTAVATFGYGRPDYFSRMLSSLGQCPEVLDGSVDVAAARDEEGAGRDGRVERGAVHRLGRRGVAGRRAQPDVKGVQVRVPTRDVDVVQPDPAHLRP